MARLRTLKPSFFKNELLAECDPLARILFEGLWTEADRDGRLEDRPKRIKVEILPYDDCDVDELLDQLAQRGFIVRYEVDRRRLIQVDRALWRDQRIHRLESVSVLPPPGADAETARAYLDRTDDRAAEAMAYRRWRAAVLARDERRCRRCGSDAAGAKRGLHAHHVEPWSRAPELRFDVDNGLTLCEPCHTATHARRP